MIKSIKKLQKEIRDINVVNGWKVPVPEDWLDDNRVPTFISLIHSEITETTLGYWAGDYANVAEEFADITIRCIDLISGLDWNFKYESITKVSDISINMTADWKYMHVINYYLLHLHNRTTRALEGFRHDNKPLFTRNMIIVINIIDLMCHCLKIDLEKEIEKKLVKNKTRGIKHGGKKI